MKALIVFHPFMVDAITITIYDNDGSRKGDFIATMDSFYAELDKLKNQFGIEKVTLKGNQMYLSKFQKDISNTYNEIEVEIK